MILSKALGRSSLVLLFGVLFIEQPAAIAAPDAAATTSPDSSVISPAPTTMRLSAIFVDLPEIVIWVDVRDKDDGFVQGLDKSAFQASVGDRPLSIEGVQSLHKVLRGTAYAMLMDVSLTMKRQGRFDAARAAAQALIDRMSDKDRMALLSFGSSVRVVQDFTGDKTKTKAELDQLRPTDQQTHLLAAVRKALQMMKRMDPYLPRRRVILLISDGKDEGSGLSVDSLKFGQQEIDCPVASIGYGRGPQTDLDALKKLASLSGGLFMKSPTVSQIKQTFGRLMQRLSEQYEVQTTGPDGLADGSRKRVQVLLRVQNRSFSESRGATMTSSRQLTRRRTRDDAAPASQATTQRAPYRQSITGYPWFYPLVGAAALVVLLLVATMWRRSRRRGIQPDVNGLHPDQPPIPANIGIDGPADLQKAIPGFSPAGAEPVPTIGTPQVAGSADVARGTRIEIQIVQGPGKLVTLEPVYFVTEAGLTIGREGDVRLENDDEVSGVHCRLHRIKDRIVVEDAGSRNGTQHNGLKITGQIRIEEGDTLTLGTSTIRLRYSTAR